jgi:trk system potassium uptake protein TrkA
MKIVILGAGRVGESAAESLVSERNDITVIDTDPARLRALQERLDLRTVTGNGIQPSVLVRCRRGRRDMLIACAAQDDQSRRLRVAHDLFNIQTTVARLRSAEFEEGTPLLSKTGFAVDQVICPEASVTAYVRKLIEYPEALQVMEFAKGLISLVVVRAVPNGPFVARTLAEIPQLLPGKQVRIVAIYRGDTSLPHLDGETRIDASDEVFVLARPTRSGACWPRWAGQTARSSA